MNLLDRLDLSDFSVASAPPDPDARAAERGPRFDFVFAGDWLVRMYDAGADYDALTTWTLLHARRSRHGDGTGFQSILDAVAQSIRHDLAPASGVRGVRDRSVASVLGTTRTDGESERDHLDRMGRQVPLAFLRRRASVHGPTDHGSYARIALNRNLALPATLVAVLADSPFDGDTASADLNADWVDP